MYSAELYVTLSVYKPVCQDYNEKGSKMGTYNAPAMCGVYKFASTCTNKKDS
jgi:hypothetical protein